MAGQHHGRRGGGDRLASFTRLVGHWIRDAMTTCVAMILLLALGALLAGNPATTVADAGYRGLWMLLPFTMQMTLILVVSCSLGTAPVFLRLLRRIARWPRTEGQVLALPLLLNALLAYFYWGLSVTLGPLLAIQFAREAERRGLKVDFPFLLAATIAAGSVWQYGLSSSAALQMNTPGHFLEASIGILPLSTTIWAPAAIATNALFLAGLLLAVQWLRPARLQPLSEFPEAERLAGEAPTGEPASHAAGRSFSERLERNPWPLRLLCLGLAGWLYQHFVVQGLGLDLNAMNTALLMVALLAHRTIHGFSRALQSAIGACWSIVVLYHLYAAAAGLIQYTDLGERIAGGLASIATATTFPLFTALSSTLLAIFIPSSGGQWVVQGFVTATAAAEVGVSAQRALLAVGIGDQMGNLLSPFWAVVGAGIARIDFRSFLGYMIAFSAIWFAVGVLSMTFLPA